MCSIFFVAKVSEKRRKSVRKTSLNRCKSVGKPRKNFRARLNFLHFRKIFQVHNSDSVMLKKIAQVARFDPLVRRLLPPRSRSIKVRPILSRPCPQALVPNKPKGVSPRKSDQSSKSPTPLSGVFAWARSETPSFASAFPLRTRSSTVPASLRMSNGSRWSFLRWVPRRFFRPRATSLLSARRA